MKKILLAHGFLGFGSSQIDFGINYFNGIKALLVAEGFDVFAPSVSPIGSLEVRSGQLAAKISEHWPDDSEICVIAHSMGGLDARRVIHLHPVGRRITKLITIATPHFGSRVADAVLGKNSKILQAIPEPILANLRNATGALYDLTTRQVLQDPDCYWVKYMEVACIIKKQGLLEGSLFFKLPQAIEGAYGPNDGVVTYDSASRGRSPIAEWEMDHCEAIGWPSGYAGLETLAAAVKPPVDHLARYKKLVDQFISD
jgi:triacylglycerol lipase